MRRLEGETKQRRRLAFPLPNGVYSRWTLSTKLPLLRLPSSDYIVGIALNGVFIFSGTSEYGFDAFYPKSYGNKIASSSMVVDVDICLGNANSFSTYRYHMYSPCVYDISIKSIAEDCSQNSQCSQSVTSWALSQTPQSQQTMLPIGLARDGRIIFGPYKSDGTLWQPCDVDICNGVKTGRYYFYVSTMFHPYTVGCWGPGSQGLGIEASCSANPRKCDVSFGQKAVISIFTLALAVLIIFQ